MNTSVLPLRFFYRAVHGQTLRIFCNNPGRTQCSSPIFSISLRRGTRVQARQYSSTISPTSTKEADYDEILYQWAEDAESVEKYRPGGYHPVVLGDQLCDGRYTIVHKIGFGGNSTIWLARDVKENRYVTVKIVMASSWRDSGESKILRYIVAQPDQPGKKFMNLILDSFVHHGPNGLHQYFVSIPRRCSLAESKFCSDGVWLFPLETARAITAQLILALSYLHPLGIVHGDLHPGNILLALPDISSLSVEELYAKYTSPMKEPTRRLDGGPIPPNVPPYILPGAWFGTLCEDLKLEDANILVTDFGESWRPSMQKRYKLHVPILFRPPEAVFARKEDCPINCPADTWALGCTIYSLFAKRNIFEYFDTDFHGILAEYASMIGKPPKKWKDFIDEKGEWDVKPKRGDDGQYISLKRRVEYIDEDREGSMTAEELDDLLELLGSMFRWLPEERLKMGEIANGPWMKKWGIPAFEAAKRAKKDTTSAK
ncbi:kinase-like domain-containing protein [Xylogone sp. PMI_703]|nr:kinase-like domain-containing protein [Xylogone sp. PMI_703]